MDAPSVTKDTLELGIHIKYKKEKEECIVFIGKALTKEEQFLFTCTQI